MKVINYVGVEPGEIQGRYLLPRLGRGNFPISSCSLSWVRLARLPVPLTVYLFLLSSWAACSIKPSDFKHFSLIVKNSQIPSDGTLSFSVVFNENHTFSWPFGRQKFGFAVLPATLHLCRGFGSLPPQSD